MDLSYRKLTLMEWLESLQDEGLITVLEQLQKKTLNNAQVGKSKILTPDEILRRAEKANQDIREGRTFTREEIEKESENW